jgi:GNAT superfamily N-acetyltransferase
MDFRIDYLDVHQDAIPQLAELHHAEWLSVTPHVTVADRIAEFKERARRGSVPTAFVGLVGNRAVGMSCLVARDIESHAHLTPWLATVLVAPGYRQLGIGSALCQRASDEARRFGVVRLYLFTYDKQGFYERQGWSAFEEATDAGRSGSIMARSHGRSTDRRVVSCTSGRP